MRAKVGGGAAGAGWAGGSRGSRSGAFTGGCSSSSSLPEAMQNSAGWGALPERLVVGRWRSTIAT
eukprot:6406619-Alexandrium_andersonii.AAC.1